MNVGLYQVSPKLIDEAISIIDIPLQRKIAPISDLRALAALYKIFHSKQFDAIHSLTPKAGLLAMVAAFLSGTPNRFHTFTGQIWVHYRGMSRIIFKKIDWIIVKIATKVFSDSPSQMEFLIKQGICSADEISVLGPGSISGVDLLRFKANPGKRSSFRKKLGADNSTCVFLFLGRLCKDKGLFDLLYAYSMLHLKEKNIALWIVGPDEEQIESKVGKLEVLTNNGVMWLGSTLSPESYMAAADILILPSYREGFGLVIIEAAACCLTTVAYRIDGVSDAIIEDETGLLCTLGDIEELESAMTNLIKNQVYRSELGKRAHSYVANKFSSAIVTSAWIEFYGQLQTRSFILSARIKRFIDLIIGTVGVIFLFAPIIFIGLLILIVSGRPVLHWSLRVGKNEALFRMPKFRTMQSSAPILATHLMANPSSYLTGIGSFLRKTSLDELPQIWSILKGDMSFVGPRPALFNQDDLIAARRDLGINGLVPGLTGLAQINGRDELNQTEKVIFDLKYLQSQSLSFDIYIMWRTLIKVIYRVDISH